MDNIIKKINSYIDIQEKNDAISLSLKIDSDIKDIVEIVRKSDNMEKMLSMFNDDVREQIIKLVEGGIIS